MFKVIFVLVSFIFIGPLTPNGGYAAAIPSDDQVLIQTGKAEHASLPNQFKVLIWNVHKAEDGTQWQNDFLKLSAQSDIALIQEAYLNTIYRTTIDSISHFLFLFATSFIYNSYETGVSTGSHTKPIQTQWLRSTGREPIVNSPKMTLLTQYNLSQNKFNLLIANIHGINFVTNSTFFEQVNQVVQAIEKHDGPLIFAGDFNTWNDGRMKYLTEACKKLGLTHLQFKEEPRSLALDHVFYRNLLPIQSKILSEVRSSDHYPLSITFKTVPVKTRSNILISDF